jgi:hypothetical protein
VCKKSTKCTHVGKDFIAETTERILIKFCFLDVLSKLHPFLLLFLIGKPHYMFVMPLKPNCLELSQVKIILRNLGRTSLASDVYTTFVLSRLLVCG